VNNAPYEGSKFFISMGEETFLAPLAFLALFVIVAYLGPVEVFVDSWGHGHLGGELSTATIGLAQ